MDTNKDNYIDTIQLRNSVFFGDGGRKIDTISYSTHKKATGNEWVFDYLQDGEMAKGEKINRQQTLFGARLYKTPKAFVNWYGFHLQISAPPALARQQASNHSNLIPIKCSMAITINSLIELQKSDVWMKWDATKSNTYKMDEKINAYILDVIDMEKLSIMKWNSKWNTAELTRMIKRDNSIRTKAILKPIDMELSQVDFCVNTIASSVSDFYNLLQHAGNYQRKNMKLYHNNTYEFDATYTIGNYNANKEVVVKTPGSISTKANGLEFRRGTKSSQVVKFYDYTRKSLEYQQRTWLPIYQANGEDEKIDVLKEYYGGTIKEINERKTTMRYEVSYRNVVGGNKGVTGLYKQMYPNMEDRYITLVQLFDAKYGKVIGRVMRTQLLNIFGDVIEDKKIAIGEHMDKFEVVKKHKLAKGLQIMAILQLMDGENGLSMQEVKTKLIESGVSYELVRRLLKQVKEEGYASNWNNERVIAMNIIKDIYRGLDEVK